MPTLALPITKSSPTFFKRQKWRPDKICLDSLFLQFFFFPFSFFIAVLQ